MENKIKIFEKLFNLSAEFISNTLDEIGISADDPKAKDKLAFLFCNDTIKWYCENCDERLDLQPGFSRMYHTFTCKSCHHKNVLDYRSVDWE